MYAQRAEEFVDFIVFGTDEALQILFQRARQRRRFSAGGDRELHRALFHDRGHDEFAEVRDVDNVDRDLARAAIGRDARVHIFIVRRCDDNRCAVEIARVVLFLSDFDLSINFNSL